MERRFFDNTQVSAHRDCSRLYYYRHVEHLRPDSDDAPPLVFGLAWHSAMDAVWPLLCGAKTLPDSLEVVRAGFGAFMRVWQEMGFPSQSAISVDREIQQRL